MAQHTADSSTQKFTEIQDIVESTVIFSGNNASLVIEVAAVNFFLLSRDEQDAKVSAYASFLNSLSFPIQILAINKRVNISAYIQLLNDSIHSLANPKVAAYMQQYREFVQELVKQNVVLDKKFYIVLHYSYLEASTAKSVASVAGRSGGNDFVNDAVATLRTKADGIRAQLERLNLSTKILEQEQLISLFAGLYNEDK